MLLIVTLGLVVASLVLLIIGFVQDHLGYIYLSMLCAGVAGVALIVFARLARRRATVVTARGMVAGEPPAPAAVEEQREGVAARGPSRRVRTIVEPETPEAPESVSLATTQRTAAVLSPPPASKSVPPAAADGWQDEGGDEEWADDWGDEVVFPIEDYDDLRVSEILPLLPELEPDELEEVRDREASGKGRASILDRIDERLGRRPAPAPTASRGGGGPAKKAPAPTTAGTRGAATAKKATSTSPTPAKKAGRPGATRGAPAAPSKSTAKAAPATSRASGAKAQPSKTPPSKATRAAQPPASRASAGAKKAATAKTAATAKKAAPTKRAATAKKAAPTKKASGGRRTR